ncbi:MAG: ATP-dependent 6-phosphofructokinase [Gemmatimonadetes bacterium]|nr:ATP-dependent 6-phosphofructokinase [Gemmatimonadota bacterium]
MRIAVNTGGGDAPGLNAVIRAVVLSAINEGWEVYGIRDGFGGLLRDSEYNGEGVVPLTAEIVTGITHTGGTILGTSNRGNPMKWPQEQPDGTVIEIDRSDEIIEEFRKRGLDCLISIGGDGSLAIARRLRDRGLPVIGIPKTIDNDLGSTVTTFGFLTAVETATDAIDKLHTTAESHKRTFVVEVMGRHSGWIALFAGVAGTADVILIPEIPYSMEKVFEKVRWRYEVGREFAVVVVAEGAKEIGGKASFIEEAKPGQEARYGGLAEKIAHTIEENCDVETRSLVLGHLQRGGQPISYDRLLALRFGAAAIELVKRGDFGSMVSLDPPDVRSVPLGEALAKRKNVPVDGDVVRTARALGISFGD